MIKRLLLSLAFTLGLSIAPAFADGPFGGVFPDPGAGTADNDFQYLGLGSASSTLNNERLLNLDATYFDITDNGAGANYTVSLKTVPVAKGGTGQTSIQAAINSFLDGIAGTAAANGQIIYRTGGNWTRLATDTDGKVLTLTSGLPTWEASASGAPASAEYLVNTLNGSLTNERRLQGTSNKITLTDGGANADLVLNVGTDITQNTATQTLTNKSLTDPHFTWNAGNGVTLEGQSFNSKLLWADWPAARNITIPDPGTTNASVLLTEGAQTKAGILTLSAAPVLSTGTLTAGANLQTFPSSAQTLVGRTSTDTLTNKELTAPSISSASTLTLKQSTANYTIDWANPAAGRAYHIREVAADADFAMLGNAEAYVAGGAVYSDANTLKITAAGTSGHPLVSGGASAPSYSILGFSGGGTGANITAVNGGLLYSNATTGAVSAAGTSGQVALSGGAGAPTWGIPTLANGGSGAAITAVNGGLIYSNATTMAVGAAGTSGQAALSGGAGAPTWGTLGPTAGGTGLTTYTTGDLPYATATNTLGKLAAGTNGHVLTLASGVPTWAASAAGSGTSGISAVKTADETVNNSATIQDDDHLVCAVGASETWAFNCTLYHTYGGNSGNMDAAFTGPSGCSIEWGFDDWQLAQPTGMASGSGSEAFLDGTSGITYVTKISGYITTAGTSGNLQLRWAQNVANASDCIVKKGSTLSLVKKP